MKGIIDHLKTHWVKYGFETLVVTAGILGAFMLNNWNENRLERKLEVATLTDLRASLNSNLKNIERAVRTLNSDAAKVKSLINHLEAKKPFADSLAELFYYPYRGHLLTVNKSVYDMLENRGIEIVSDRGLRTEIVDHFSFQLLAMESFSRTEMDRLSEFRNYYQTKVVPDNKKLFVGHTGREYPLTFPVDYEGLLEDGDFINQLKWASK